MSARLQRNVLRAFTGVGVVWVSSLLTWPYLVYRWQKYRGPPFIEEWDGVDSTLAQSRTVKQYINPLGNKYWADSRSITFNNLRDRKSGKLLSDAEILKRLCIGFWGGTVFSYEKSFLRAIPRDRVHFELDKKSDRGDMFATFRPGRMNFEMERGDHLYGAFQILDMAIRPPGQEKLAVPRPLKDPLELHDPEGFVVNEASSYVDFGYGSSRPGSKFTGVHRFSVTRLPPEVVEGSNWQTERQNDWIEEDGGRVKVTFESYTCSPTPGGGRMMDWGRKYHKIYAGMLFSNGVSAVVRGGGRSKGS